MARQMQKFLTFPMIQTFCYTKLLAANPPWWYQSIIFTRKILLCCQTILLVHCNGTRINQINQKLNICPILIRLHIQTRFPSNRQLPGFIPSRSLSTTSLLYKIIRYHCLLFHTFFETSKGPSCGNLYFCLKFLCIITTFFHSYLLHFSIKTSINIVWVLNSFEGRNFKRYCSQWKLQWLRNPKFEYSCDSGWDSKSFVFKTTD